MNRVQKTGICLITTLLVISTVFAFGACTQDDADDIIDKGKEVWEEAKEAAPEVWEETKDIASDVWEGTKDTVGDIIDSMSDD